MKRLFAACIILAASALLFTSCGSKSNDADEDEDDAPRSKKTEKVERHRASDSASTGEDIIFGGKAKASSKKLSVGFAQTGAESDWRKASTVSIKEEAKARNTIDLDFFDSQYDGDKQISAIRTFIKKKVDVIAFSPVWSSGFEDVLKEAKKAGIPVVLFDRAVDADSSLYVSLVGSDFVEEGRRAARWLLANVGENANVAELVGTVGSAPAVERKKGFEEVIKDHPGIKIIKSQSGEFTRAYGKRVMEAFLKSPEASKINVVFAHNDDMALGAIQAIEEAGKVPGKDIIIISIDGIKTMFRAILDGKANCTVECNPLVGPVLFDVIEKVAKGETVPKYIPTVEGVFDSVGDVEVGDRYDSVKTIKVTQEIVDGRMY